MSNQKTRLLQDQVLIVFHLRTAFSSSEAIREKVGHILTI